MRRTYVPAVAASLLVFAGATTALAQDASRAVAGGGISVAGWAGKIDASEAGKGGKLEDSKLAKMGNDLHVTTGPAVAYWNPANKASGNYTVSAKFTESKYMGLNDHPHPYGIVIGGNDLGTDTQSYLYCAAYGNGRFIVRGFGPAPFQLYGRGEANEAVNKAAGKDQPVTQEIAMSVKGDDVTCSVNGKVVGTYKKADIVGPGKLKSLDGTYGIRFGHNTEAHVSGLTMTKN
jgi:hypothetical protein